jgi:uncharacterized repeat protein (TIGR03803 family)
VFKLSPNGTYTVLYSFTGGSDGAFPKAGLIADNAGNLYGTGESGGASGKVSGNGVVFKLSPGGTSYTVLYSFMGSDGGSPYAGLLADSSGNLYGTTELGGAPRNSGTVFKLAGTGFVPPPPPPPPCTCSQCCDNAFSGCVNACPDAGDCPGEPPQAERNCLQDVGRCFRSCFAALKRCIASCK